MSSWKSTERRLGGFWSAAPRVWPPSQASRRLGRVSRLDTGLSIPENSSDLPREASGGSSNYTQRTRTASLRSLGGSALPWGTISSRHP